LPRAFDLRVTLCARSFVGAGIDLFFAEAAPELLADAEEREPQIERPVGSLLEKVGRADVPVLARPRRQVCLQLARRAAGIAAVELGDGLGDGGRVALERARGIPPAGCQDGASQRR
jgi:hypothetical protein